MFLRKSWAACFFAVGAKRMRPSAASTLHVKVPPWAEMHLLHYGRIPGPNVQSRANLTERDEYTSADSADSWQKKFYFVPFYKNWFYI